MEKASHIISSSKQKGLNSQTNLKYKMCTQPKQDNNTLITSKLKVKLILCINHTFMAPEHANVTFLASFIICLLVRRFDTLKCSILNYRPNKLLFMYFLSPIPSPRFPNMTCFLTCQGKYSLCWFVFVLRMLHTFASTSTLSTIFLDVTLKITITLKSVHIRA